MPSTRTLRSVGSAPDDPQWASRTGDFRGGVLELISDMGQATLPLAHGLARATDASTESQLAVFEAIPARHRATAGDIALAADVRIPTCLGALTALESAGSSKETSEAGSSRSVARDHDQRMRSNGSSVALDVAYSTTEGVHRGW